jgi:cell division septum initiation protein DivIVA
MDGTESLYKTSDLFEQLLIRLVEKQQLEIAHLKEDIKCYEGMKDSIQIRITDLERERDQAIAASWSDRSNLS